jgi:hypothetical protein
VEGNCRTVAPLPLTRTERLPPVSLLPDETMANSLEDMNRRLPAIPHAIFVFIAQKEKQSLSNQGLVGFRMIRVAD